MFSVSMKKRLGLMMVSTATVAVTCLTSLQAAAGDGRNGPQLSGNAIPVHVDRAIEDVELRNAVRKCNVKLMKNLFVQIFKEEPKTYFSYVGEVKSFLLRDQGDSRAFIKSWPEIYADANSRDPRSISFKNSDRSGWSTIKINNALGEARLKRKNSPDILPTFNYTQKIERTYNELGQVLQQRILAVDVSINAPMLEFNVIADFRNEETDKEVPLQLNTQEYALCLLSEIQKRD